MFALRAREITNALSRIGTKVGGPVRLSSRLIVYVTFPYVTNVRGIGNAYTTFVYYSPVSNPNWSAFVIGHVADNYFRRLVARSALRFRETSPSTISAPQRERHSDQRRSVRVFFRSPAGFDRARSLPNRYENRPPSAFETGLGFRIVPDQLPPVR